MESVGTDSHLTQGRLRTIVEHEGLTYCNTGDWVEHCTALVEHIDGMLELTSYHPGEFSHLVEMLPEQIAVPTSAFENALEWDAPEPVSV